MTDTYSESPTSGPSMAGAPAVKWLLGLNVAVFLLQTTLVAPDTIYGALGLDPANFPARWWTAVSYMFVHAGLLHLAMNMVTLWMFGTRLEEAWASRTFLYFYIWCGIGGAVAHLLFARDAGLVGASAAVSGVLMAYGFRWPEERVYLFGVIPIRSRWLVGWMIAINIAIGLSANTLIGWKAHLGGLVFGWLFLQARSPEGSGRMRRWASALPDEPDVMPHAIPKRAGGSSAAPTGGYEPPSAKVRATTRPANATQGRLPMAPRLNSILDKISRSGIESLSAEERTLLDNASRELRRPGTD